MRKKIKLISFDSHPYKLRSLTVVIWFSPKQHRLAASGQNLKVSKWEFVISQILQRQAQSSGNPFSQGVARGRGQDQDQDSSFL